MYDTGGGPCNGSAEYCSGHGSGGGGGGTPSVGECATNPEICGLDNLNPSGAPPVGECATHPEICGLDALEPNGPGAHAVDHKNTNGSVGDDTDCPARLQDLRK